MAIDVFNRTEIKYLITLKDYEKLRPLLNEYMNADSYNCDDKPYKICNIYYDTLNNDLIRKSLLKPVYKEKLRLRSYGQVNLTDRVYLEIKKKFKGVVYKRRTGMTLQQAYDFLQNKEIQLDEKINKQILSEIKDLRNRYELNPAVYISYDRFAFFSKADNDFRLTLDTNIQTRRENLRLDEESYGMQLLPPDTFLMEAKAYKTFPLWFADFLAENKIFNVSFSKYGNEFKREVLKNGIQSNNANR